MDTKRLLKRFSLLCAGIGVVIGAFLVGRFVSGRIFPSGTTISGVSFSFQSSFPQYQINNQSVNKDLLAAILSSAGYNRNNKSFGVIGDTKRIEPKKVTIIFADITKTSPEDLLDTVQGGGKTVRGFSSAINKLTNELFYTIYYDPLVFTNTNKSASDIQSIWQEAVVRLFYVVFYPQDKPFDANAYKEFTKSLNASFPNTKPLFEMTIKKQSALPFIFQLVSNVFKPALVEAACSGSYICGTQRDNCLCGDSRGDPCTNDGGQCYFDPITGPKYCTCFRECDQGPQRDCSAFTQAICQSGGGQCASGTCTYAWGCSWSGGAGPTPTPGGPTTPPGYGACGGCDCGHGGECRTDPSGACVWDPCGCAGIGCAPGGPTPTPAPTANCGDACIVSRDCKQYVEGNPNVQCLWMATGKRCVNQNCPNNTIPGTICGCSGGVQCGANCTGSGGCTGSSVCTYLDHSSGICPWGSTTYCVGSNGGTATFNPSYTRPQCGGAGGDNMAQYLLGPGGKQSFNPAIPADLAAIQSTCPKATITAIAKVISTTDITCPAITASTSYATGTSFALSPTTGISPAGAQTQSGSTAVSWSAPAATYSLSGTAPAGYVLQNSCWTRSSTAPLSGTGMSEGVSAVDTLAWQIGYSIGSPWVQTLGGDVLARTSLTSRMTTVALPRLFSVIGVGGSPGMVSYGTSYDFNADTSDPTYGAAYTSSTNWLAQDGEGSGRNGEDPFTTDWYNYFLYKFDRSPSAPAPNSTPDYDNPATPITKPASSTTPYLVSGNMETSGDWVIGANETIIFLVSGNATIKGKINITAGGFFALIANGNIIIDPTVGVPFSSSVPAVEGIYITSPTGSFITGQSTNGGTERFVGKGSFIAGTFLLQRSLDTVGHNGDTSSELFIYNPQLLFAMPDKMKTQKIKWTEAAP